MMDEILKRLDEIDGRLAALENQTKANRPLGPRPETSEQENIRMDKIQAIVDTVAINRNDVTLTDGSPVTDDHRDIDATGMQKDYVVLSDVERAKGFVRPVRNTYRHVGISGPKYKLRLLTSQEYERYKDYGYVKYEEYPAGSGALGKYWMQHELDGIPKGCGTTTTMASAIAETYARDPKFYGETFCANCRTHFPVGASGEFVWDKTNERVGT